MNQTIVVLDFGGQYKELIARTVRSLGVYSVICPGSLSAQKVQELNPVGVILTGGPDSVYGEHAAAVDPEIFRLGIPVLGICYGMQLLCHVLGGTVIAGTVGEYGRVLVTPTDGKPPFYALMSHRDAVSRAPDGFTVTAHTQHNIAAVKCDKKRLYGVQFHPETAHTENGSEILKNFLYDVCKATGDYHPGDYLRQETERLRGRVGNQRVLLGLSGGVDSSVCAALLSRALPEQLTCVFVDHGFMRQDEGDQIEAAFRNHRLNFVRVNAQQRFLKRLGGVADPEQKRKIIGEEFVRVFEEEAAKQGRIPFLAQGTIYPDVVESGKAGGATIKSHHNVGGLPDDVNFIEVLEPLRGLFKDEVRRIGHMLGLPRSLTNRQPFPGPGLAIRIMGEVTHKKLEILRHADQIVRFEIGTQKKHPDQFFAVLTDTYSVGVKGDGRSYDAVIAVRAVQTVDFMTCRYAPLSHRLLGKISGRITAEVDGVSRVVYDITDKPPATVEWE